MVKKIEKTLKFVVCCMLITSLVAPSYAALSASDGSAFVTKAEFDAALADFNARLTTFEAGINSKIDSQVTSYLDRNGIWNGKTQIIEATVTKNIIWVDVLKPTWQVGDTGYTARYSSAKKVINDCNKSGLIDLFFSFVPSGEVQCYADIAGTGGSWVQSDSGSQTLLLGVSSGLTAADAKSAYTWYCGAPDWGYHFNNWGNYQIPYNASGVNFNYLLKFAVPAIVNHFFFFVDKGNQIYFRGLSTLSLTNGLSIRSLNCAIGNDTYCPATLTINAKIY